MTESAPGHVQRHALDRPIVVELSLDSVEELAEAIARRMGPLADSDRGRDRDHDDDRDQQQLITASELASRIGRSAAWVRQHRWDLGGVVVGDGPRPRIWFDPSRVTEALASCSASRKSDGPEPPARPASRPRARRSPLGTNVELLPIRPPNRPNRRRPETRDDP